MRLNAYANKLPKLSYIAILWSYNDKENYTTSTFD